MIDDNGAGHDPAREAVTTNDFAILVKRHWHELNRYVFWLTRDQAAAQDIVQETLLRAWRSLHKVKKRDALWAWLLTILRRESARHFARSPRAKSQIPVGELADERVAYDTSTEAFVVRCALADLPEGLRLPLVMQVVDGYSLAEIAQRLKITEGGAGTRLHRARQRLRARLGAQDAV